MFQEDLKIGQEHEILFGEQLLNNGFKAFNTNDNSDFDLIAFSNGKFRTFEIKYDKYNNTRVAVEIYCLRRLKETGVMTTKADFIVFDKGEEYYITTPQKLKNLLKPSMFVLGGDESASVLALVELDLLKTVSRIIHK